MPSYSQPICFKFKDTGSCPYGSRCKYSHDAGPQDSAALSDGGGRNSIAAFFRSYSSFQYDPEKDAYSEWRRLCASLDLDPRDKTHPSIRALRDRLRTAMVRQFNQRFGEDADDLAAWQALCRRVGIQVEPTLELCQAAIKRTYVNLVDLTELRDGAVPTKFRSELTLSNYTKNSGKYFPKDHIEAGNLLRMLLRQINNPSAQ